MTNAQSRSQSDSHSDNDADRRVRHAIYGHTIAHGGVPGSDELAAALDLSTAEVDASLLRLADRHLIALAPGTTNIWMAHPFSAVPTAYRVETAKHVYWANCAWDALGIPAMLGVDSRTRTICPDCGDTLEIVVDSGAARSTGEVVHFGVPPRRFWENVGFT
jgi:Alkylmercury lyase